MADGSLWADSERARQTVTEVKSLKGWLEPYHALRKRVDEGRELNELLEAESHIDLAMQRSLETEADEIAGRLESLEMQNMLQGPDDARDALLTIHPGAGGRSRKIGRRCSCACTRVGRNGMASRSTCSTSCRVKRRASNPPRSRS